MESSSHVDRLEELFDSVHNRYVDEGGCGFDGRRLDEFTEKIQINRRELATIIFEIIKPSNPHGPQSDLTYGMQYTAFHNERADQIADAIFRAGYRQVVAEVL